MLNTLQYLIVDEILLARILEQKHNLRTEYTDDEVSGEEVEGLLDEETEYEVGKGAPLM